MLRPLGCGDKRGQKARWATLRVRPRRRTDLLPLSRVAGGGDAGEEGWAGRRENDVKDSKFGRTKRHSNGLEAGKKKNGSRLEDVLEFQPGGAWKQGLCRGSRVKCGHRGAPSACLPGSLEKGEVWTQRQTHAEGRHTEEGPARRKGRRGTSASRGSPERGSGKAASPSGVRGGPALPTP